MPEASPANLLIVDDEAPQLKALSVTLESAGFSVLGFTSPQEALAALEGQRFDLLLTDLKMPGMDGISLLRAALGFDRDLVVIVMTGHGTIDTAVEAMKAGALDYILKPFKLSAMQPVLDRALAVRKLRLDNALLSRRVAERTAELEAANKELEAFSHSVSHDLRAPLRHIQGFAGILAERFVAQIPPEAQRYLGVIVSGAKRMEQLIEDLLRFSRTGRQPLSLHPIDMASMADGLVAELKRDVTDRVISWQVGELPPCQGDPSLLLQVWINLLSNAVKFTSKRDSAVIEVGSEPGEGGPVYFIRDNGAGFDMNQAGKLFGVFQRIHRQEDFEGTGVGLSIVQRIIQRHGGRIWVRSEVDVGTTFFFSLPAVREWA